MILTRSPHHQILPGVIVVAGTLLTSTTAVLAAGAQAGSWSFSGVLRTRTCDSSGRCTTGSRDLSLQHDISEGQLPTPGPLVPCQPAAGQLPQLARYVGKAATARRFRLTLSNKAAVLALFRACSDASLSLGRMSSRLTIAANGQSAAQKDLLTYSRVQGGRRLFVTRTAKMSAARTGAVSGSFAASGDTGDAGRFKAPAGE